jgi:hypothetical protein
MYVLYICMFMCVYVCMHACMHGCVYILAPTDMANYSKRSRGEICLPRIQDKGGTEGGIMLKPTSVVLELHTRTHARTHACLYRPIYRVRQSGNLLLLFEKYNPVTVAINNSGRNSSFYLEL